MITMKAEVLLKPGDTVEHPLSFLVRNQIPDEDGARAGFEMRLTLEEARSIALDLAQAIRWVEDGVWKPVPSAAGSE